MRLFPILAAIAVVAAIYGLVFERERLVALLPAPAAELAQATADAGEATPGGETAEAARSAEEAPGAGVVRVVALHSAARPIDRAVILRGRTEADRVVELRAETTGQVISPPRKKGTRVAEGEALCRLDPGTRPEALAEARARLEEARARVPEAEARQPEAEARLEEARARLREAEARLAEARINYNAATRLSEEGFASETRRAAAEAALRGAEAAVVSARTGVKTAETGLETVRAAIMSARAGVSSAEAAVAAAEREIARLTIAAPFAGTLEDDSAELGTLLQPGSLCATVIRLDPMVLVGFTSEIDIARVRVGAPAEARLATGERLRGEVVFAGRVADPATRTFRVEVEVPNPDMALRDGQTAEIAIEAEGTRAHLLPLSALTLDDEGVMGVRVVAEGGKAGFVPVTVLRDTPQGVWITGLPDSADVIVIGQDYVTDGVRVEASFREIGQ